MAVFNTCLTDLLRPGKSYRLKVQRVSASQTCTNLKILNRVLLTIKSLDRSSIVMYRLEYCPRHAQYHQLCTLPSSTLRPFAPNPSISAGILTHCRTSAVPTDARSKLIVVCVTVWVLRDRTGAATKVGSAISIVFIVSQTVICRWTSTMMATEYIP